jgi:hypothetical protein
MKPTKVTPLQNNRNSQQRVPVAQKRPQPWTWAQKHERRLEKGWNWQMIDAKGSAQRSCLCGACRLLCTNGKRLGSMASINPCGRLLII